jgi:hypothetical protein
MIDAAAKVGRQCDRSKLLLTLLQSGAANLRSSSAFRSTLVYDSLDHRRRSVLRAASAVAMMLKIDLPAPTALPSLPDRRRIIRFRQLGIMERSAHQGSHSLLWS